jgi:RES domain
LTPEDLALDVDLLLRDAPLILYRLARARYANISGVGAAQYPGRWNRLGQEAIYTSTEMSAPILERLVHTTKDLIPANLALMKIRVSGKWERFANMMMDSHTGGYFSFYRSLAHAKSALNSSPYVFGHGVNPFAVAVPSVIVPVWNVVLYPQAPGFWNHVALETVERFEFDPRLFPENTPVATPE